MKKKQNVENSVDYRVTFEFVEKIRQTFADADTDQTGYLDVNEFTVFMRKTFPKMTDRDAQLIFMKIGEKIETNRNEIKFFSLL